MIAKAIVVSFTKKSLKKLRISRGQYEWSDSGYLLSNYVTVALYLLLNSINPDIRIGVPNLKDEIEKATIYKFGNNVKDLLDEISSNYYIIIDKGERYEYYVCLIFRALLSVPN